MGELKQAIREIENSLFSLEHSKAFKMLKQNDEEIILRAVKSELRAIMRHLAVACREHR